MSSTQYESVRRYTEAKQAGDTETANAIAADAISRFDSRTITADEYNALLNATMTTRLGEGL
ncbi:hypothetical protein P3T35_003045 [Kitasatospora sp. GP30]|uniref:hypothetical protein n=1 Tax=Kitasatospora sp. GP30 TaxID=3035084 RepID=UPI000C71005D|nr:hypothetical protein [Kitasatospora sp. GP30]MDH6141032.1 hypothetical protein [Kitasatospora sp. GP30]